MIINEITAYLFRESVSARMDDVRMNVELTRNEINLLCELLRDSAQGKKRRARQLTSTTDRTDMERSAMRDYELRKKLIAAKVTQ